MHVCRDWEYFCLSCLEAGIPLGIPDDLMQNHSRPGFSYWKHWQTLLNHKKTSLKCCPREAVNKPSKTMCSSMESDTGVTSKLDDPLKVNDAVGRLNSTNSSAL